MAIKETISKDAADFFVMLDENGCISKKSKEQFKKNGFITFPPGYIDEHVIDTAIQEANRFLPDWTDGTINPELEFSKFKHRFVNHFMDGNVGYNGCPLEQCITRGNGSVHPEKNTNYLFGKRATLVAQHWSKSLAGVIENKKIMSIAQQLLHAEELSFHNGSVARSYPGVEGEAKAVHSDLQAFTKTPFEAAAENRFVLNIFLYLSDVTEDTAPIRLIPETHPNYLRLNDYIASHNAQSTRRNFLDKALPLYEELLPEDLMSPIKLIGEKGTIIALHCALLHAATANQTASNSRTVMILNYADRKNKEFYKSYPKEDQNACKSFAGYFDDRELIEYTFLNKSQPHLSKTFSHAISKAKSHVKSGIALLSAIHYYKVRPALQRVIPMDERMFLNLGAGANWRHHLFVSTDVDSRTNMSIDLSKNTPLPFAENRFAGIYSSHMMEHLKCSEVKFLLKQVYRCLGQEGVFRIVVPDLGKWLDAYERRNITFFMYSLRGGGVFHQDSWLRLIVRQFAEPVVDKFSDTELYETYCKMGRVEFLDYFQDLVEKEADIKRLSPHTHKTWFSKEKMEMLLNECGFKNISEVTPDQSSCKVFITDMGRFDGVKPGRNVSSLFMEAIK